MKQKKARCQHYSLHKTEAWINGKKGIALVDSGFSQSLVTGLVCSPLSHKELNIMTTNDEIIHSYGIATIMLAVDNLNPIRTDVLVVNSQLLGFDMLLGMNIIKILESQHQPFQ